MNKNQFRKLLMFALIPLLFLNSCDDDDSVAPPEEEDEVEVITDAVLMFTPASGAPITMTFVDPDGQDGPMSGTTTVSGAFAAGITYTLSIQLTNGLADDVDEADISAEVSEEDDEHQFFFAWTDALFEDPMGDGNIGASEAGDPVNYDPDEEDENGLPLGIEGTTWTAGAAGSTGSFTMRLQHQPPVNGVAVKTATSTSEDGDTDIDVTFMGVSVQ